MKTRLEIIKQSQDLIKNNHYKREFLRNSDYYLSSKKMCYECEKLIKGVHVHKYSDTAICPNCLKYQEQAI
tara:strand:- start:382 stop:594 length:213 start_codon:yes stop_codon:yes gene_type:complete